MQLTLAHQESSKRAVNSRSPVWLIFWMALMLGNISVPAMHAAVGGAGERAARADETAKQSLLRGQIDQSVSELQRILAANPKDGEADLLLCRSFYAEEQQDDAITACESAVQLLPQSSEAWDWMGRAYGMKANQAGALTGFTLARKVKTDFETAVQLDPDNGPAVNDLGEFYIGAPEIIGGGQDKAIALAERVQSQLPQQAHRIQAMAAEKRKDYGTAEREFKSAVAVANRPDAWDDLGGYYRRRGEDDKAVDALNQSFAIDHAKDAAVVDAASILDTMHREPQLAEKALRQYLSGNAKSDAAPVIKVDVMLGQLLAQHGDKAGAKIEFNEALQLASNYAPAKRALRQTR